MRKEAKQQKYLKDSAALS